MNLYDQVTNLYEFSKLDVKRVGTGIREVDQLCRGPLPGELFTVMGRSYSGKSIIGQNICLHNAKLPSIFFSMEMPTHTAIMRLYSMWSGMSHTEVQNRLEEKDLPTDMYSLADMMPYHRIVDKPARSLGDLSRELEDFEDEYKMRPEFIVIDYLELLGGAKTGEANSVEAQVTMLKDWAKEEEMRVFALHQANRLEKKWDPPTEDSARYGGYTESDFMIGLWRPHTNPELGDLERLRLHDVIACNILKNRPYMQERSYIEIHVEASLRIKEYSAGNRIINEVRSVKPWVDPI